MRNSNFAIPDELDALINRILDGRGADDDSRRLEQLLHHNVDAQAYYLEMCQIHCLITFDLHATRAVDRTRLATGASEVTHRSGSRISKQARQPWLWFVAASVLAASVLLLIGRNVWSPQPDHVGVAAQSQMGFEPQDIQLPIGVTELALGDFGTAIVQGPGYIEWLEPMRMKIHEGRIRVRIYQPKGRGFVVEMPHGEVVDLGTEFAIDVSSEQVSTVVVFEGAVDLSVLDSKDKVSRQTRRMFGGDGVVVNARGAFEQLMTIVTGHYPTFAHINEHATTETKPILLNVVDNIRSPDIRRFYEIIPGGLKEDALAYVDRHRHEWNGVDARGLPAYLLGADYIKTYNIDRRRRQMQVEVTLGQPAKLYVFFDARLPIPDWLSNDFRETGDKIGLDLGAYASPDGRYVIREPTGVGPGNSVDAEFTIWVRDCHEPGPVTLGPTAGATNRSAMYGIAATPL